MKGKRSKRKAAREDRLMLLSPRESQVVELMGKGLSSDLPATAVRIQPALNAAMMGTRAASGRAALRAVVTDSANTVNASL